MTLVAAALVPESVLLLPGAAGRADPLAAVRDAVDGALRHLLEARPARVLVVLGGAPRSVHLRSPQDGSGGRVRLTLGALGLPDTVLGPPDARAHDRPVAGDTGKRGESGDTRDTGDSGANAVIHEPGAVVALTLLRRAGYDGSADVHVVGDAAAAETLGESAEAAADDVALLLVGSLSARRGPDAPLAEDPRAAEVDERAALALTRLAPEDLRWLREVRGTARELAISAVVPWAALLGALAAGARLEPSAEPLLTAPLGADLVVARWDRAAGGVR